MRIPYKIVGHISIEKLSLTISQIDDILNTNWQWNNAYLGQLLMCLTYHHFKNLLVGRIVRFLTETIINNEKDFSIGLSHGR